MISLSEAKSGVLASAEGMPALKECPEKYFACFPTCFSSSYIMVLVKMETVKFFPFLNWNTGKFFNTFCWLDSAKFFKAEKGQKLLFFILKMSTKSPALLRMTLGNLMFITAEFFAVK